MPPAKAVLKIATTAGKRVDTYNTVSMRHAPRPARRLCTVAGQETGSNVFGSGAFGGLASTAKVAASLRLLRLSDFSAFAVLLAFAENQIRRTAMRKRIMLSALVAVIVLGVYSVSYRATKVVAQAAIDNLSFVPYMLEQQSLSLDSGGRLTVNEDRIRAVRRDGAEAWLSTRPNRPEVGTAHMVIQADGRRTVGLLNFGGKFTHYLSGRRMAARKARAALKVSGCRFPYETHVGDETVLGARAAILVWQQDQNNRSTSWRALDYDCALLKLSEEKLTPEGWKLSLEVVPVMFKGGDPPESMFDEQKLSLLQELPPSELRRRVYDALGVNPTKCPTCFDPAADRGMDEAYFRSQVPY